MVFHNFDIHVIIILFIQVLLTGCCHNNSDNNVDIINSDLNGQQSLNVNINQQCLSANSKDTNDYILKAYSSEDKFKFVEIFKSQGKEATNKLTAALENSNWEIRAAALYFLSEILDSSTIPQVIKCLSDEYEVNVEYAICVLRDIGQKDVVWPIMRVVRDKTRSTILKRTAVQALELLKEQSLNPLIESLKDPDSLVREYAAKILGDIGEASSVPYLIEALEDSDINVRFAAILALGFIKDKRAVEGIIKSYERRGDDIQASSWEHDYFNETNQIDDFKYTKNIQGAVFWSLGKIGDATAANFLMDKLNENDEKTISIITMGKIMDSIFVDKLVEILRTGSSTDRRYCLRSLGEIGNEKAVEPLKELISGERDDLCRLEAWIALAKTTKSREHIGKLSELLENPSEYYQKRAAMALGDIKNEETENILIGKLGKEKSKADSLVKTPWVC